MNLPIKVSSVSQLLEFLPQSNFFIRFSMLNRVLSKAILKGNAPLAQLVEQLTLNQWVRGSSPRRCTTRTTVLDLDPEPEGEKGLASQCY